MGVASRAWMLPACLLFLAACSSLPPTSSPPLPLTSSPSPPAICSPLQDIPQDVLAEHLTNPFAPPAPGSDDPHQGIDLSVFLPDTRIAIAGASIQAVMNGRVAMVTRDRFPFGNAVLIESPVIDLGSPPLPISSPTFPTSPPLTSLTCPGLSSFDWNEDASSLYLLYAHMQSVNDIQAGDPVSCGQPLGVVGASGNALNPHLHLELRIGPAGAFFPSMAHYTGSASAEEMDAYCAWRLGSWFRLIDAGLLFGIQKTD